VATLVVPFRGSDPKRRLAPVEERDRVLLAEAMLKDVVAAAAPVGRVFVVAPEAQGVPDDATHVPDPHRGQGAAVGSALDAAVAAGATGPFLVVNADLPCATPRDLLALAGAIPAGGLALAAAPDGTTNALAFLDASVFQPLYGPGSAARFAALAEAHLVDSPNLADDVDTVDDLTRLADRLGPSTRAALDALHLGRAA
jgi:2-phospho-L-lactate/phosphoenolpyruvate guanylyltransferase